MSRQEYKIPSNSLELYETKQEYDVVVDSLKNFEATFNIDKIQLNDIPQVKEFLDLQDQLKIHQFQLSNESLVLDSEYKARVKVLKDLRTPP